MTIKEKLLKLSEISKQIDNPDIELEKALELYAESVALAKECQKEIEEAKQKITTLSLDNEDE